MQKFNTCDEAFNENYVDKAQHQKSFNKKTIADLVDTIKDWFPNSASQPIEILDLCCGPGEPTFNLLNRLDKHGIQVKRVVGYDISQEQIEKAQSFAEQDKRLSFQVKNVEEMTNTAEFDVVISLFGLHWMNDIQSVVKNIYRAVKPQGKLFFFVPLEKLDLFAIRKEFMLNDAWKEFFNGFTLHPFIKNEKGYTELLANYFDAEHIVRGKATKEYTEQEFADFLSSWLQEVRHLSSMGQNKEKCEEYTQQLVKSIPLNHAHKNVYRFSTHNATKVKFMENYLLFKGSQKTVAANVLEKPDFLGANPSKNTLVNLGIFATITLGAFVLGRDRGEVQPHNLGPG